jgi:predicted GIY-YIG superfamily endonuclease
MPLTNIKYSKTTIYKLCCKDINITEIYVGHTTDMRRRKTKHKSACNNEKDKAYNYNVYQFIRANGGFENFDMIEIERYNAIDGYDATKRERYYIDELKATLNIGKPTRTPDEWCEANKEIIAEKAK